jgi:hypothetical protein
VDEQTQKSLEEYQKKKQGKENGADKTTSDEERVLLAVRQLIAKRDRKEDYKWFVFDPSKVRPEDIEAVKTQLKRGERRREASEEEKAEMERKKQRELEQEREREMRRKEREEREYREREREWEAREYTKQRELQREKEKERREIDRDLRDLEYPFNFFL